MTAFLIIIYGFLSFVISMLWASYKLWQNSLCCHFHNLKYFPVMTNAPKMSTTFRATHKHKVVTQYRKSRHLLRDKRTISFDPDRASQEVSSSDQCAPSAERTLSNEKGRYKINTWKPVTNHVILTTTDGHEFIQNKKWLGSQDYWNVERILLISVDRKVMGLISIKGEYFSWFKTCRYQRSMPYVRWNKYETSWNLEL